MFIYAYLTAPPSINPPNDTATSGDIVMFNCSTNDGHSTFKWFKGDTEITIGSPFTVINETEDLSILIIDIVTGEEYGSYTCVISNIAGTAQATAELAGKFCDIFNKYKSNHYHLISVSF